MKLRSILCGVLALAATVACKPDEPVVEPSLGISRTSALVGSEGEEITVEVTANVDWTASADQTWVTVSPTSGKGSAQAAPVKVNVAANETFDSRTATVTVTAGTLNKTMKITQTGADQPEPETYVLVGDAVGGWDVDANGVVMTLSNGYYAAKAVNVTAKKGMHFTKNNKWEGNVKGKHGLIAPNEIGEVGNNDISLTEGGKFDVYLTEALDKFYFMSEGKLPSEAVEHADIAVTWGVCGAIEGNSWGASADPEMTQDGEWYVAKGIVFTEVNFKVRGNNSWSDDVKWGRAAEDTKCELNKAVPVSTCTEYKAANPSAGDNPNIYIGGAGTYDVYFSPEKKEVWVMLPGYKPGDETPEPEPVEVSYTLTGTLEGHYWDNSAAAGLMTLENGYYVAKNVNLLLDSTMQPDGTNPADYVKFKICETGTWNAYGVAAENADVKYSPNAEIPVVSGGSDVFVDGAGVYDVYFDKDNGKVWVMTAGYKPGDEVPGGDEPSGPQMPEIPADYQATVLWEGTQDMTWSTGMQALAYGGYSWGLCKPGQFVKITVVPTDPAAQWILGLMYAGADYSWNKIPSLPDSYFQPEGGIVIFEITEEILALLAAPNNGLVLHGENVTAKKVELYAAAGSDEPADNMIANGGFENGEAGWMGWSWGPFTQEIGEGRDGGKCIVLTLGECTNLWDAQIVQDIQALTPGTYTYEFYAKSDSGDHQIQVFAQETKSYQGIYGPDDQKAAKEWTLYTGEVYYDGTVENINRFGIQFGKAGAAGAKLWIDDIKFCLKK